MASQRNGLIQTVQGMHYIIRWTVVSVTMSEGTTTFTAIISDLNAN